MSRLTNHMTNRLTNRLTNSMTDHILFATNFSDACHAAIPAVTRWVDAHNARLTILHVYDPVKTQRQHAEAQIYSFYAEADNYSNCQRVLLSGDTCDALESFCATQENGMLFLPPSDRTGLPRPFHISTRAQLLQRLQMPIWTMGRATINSNTSVAGKNIAVCLQDLDQPSDYIFAAALHAQSHGATLHMMHVVPDTTEGTLITALHTNAPLGVETAVDRLSELAAMLPASLKVHIHVRMGSYTRELKAMLRASDAELLMVGSHQSLERRFLRPTIDSMFSSCQIPIICLPERMNLHTLRDQPSLLVAA